MCLGTCTTAPVPGLLCAGMLSHPIRFFPAYSFKKPERTSERRSPQESGFLITSPCKCRAVASHSAVFRRNPVGCDVALASHSCHYAVVHGYSDLLGSWQALCGFAKAHKNREMWYVCTCFSSHPALRFTISLGCSWFEYRRPTQYFLTVSLRNLAVCKCAPIPCRHPRTVVHGACELSSRCSTLRTSPHNLHPVHGTS